MDGQRHKYEHAKPFVGYVCTIPITNFTCKSYSKLVVIYACTIYLHLSTFTN